MCMRDETLRTGYSLLFKPHHFVPVADTSLVEPDDVVSHGAASDDQHLASDHCTGAS